MKASPLHAAMGLVAALALLAGVEAYLRATAPQASPRVPAKQPGDFRVLLLGDSARTLGDGDGGYAVLVERRLARRFPPLEIVPLAAGGSGLAQYAATLEKAGLELRPDLVLLALSPESGLGEAGDAAAFERIVAAANRHRLGLAALLLPRSRGREEKKGAFARAQALCRGQKVPCLDLRRALRAHPEAEYHAAVAGAVEPFLARLVLGGAS